MTFVALADLECSKDPEKHAMIIHLDIYGQVLASRPLAAQVRGDVLRHASPSSTEVELDLANVATMSASFADELIGELDSMRLAGSVAFAVAVVHASPAIDRRISAVRARRATNAA